MPPQTILKFVSRAAAGLVCILAFTASSAYAQNGGLDPRASFFIGGSVLDGSKVFFIGPDGFKTNFQDGVKFGFRGTVNVSDHWAGEVAYGFESDGLRVTETTPVQNVTDFGVHIHQFGVNGLYYFEGRGSRIRPFATVGLGSMTYDPTGDAKTAAATNFLNEAALLHGETHFAFNLGVGAEANIMRHIAARFDLRDYITGLPRFGLPQNPQSPGAAYYPISGHVENVEISVGIVYRFH